MTTINIEMATKDNAFIQEEENKKYYATSHLNTVVWLEVHGIKYLRAQRFGKEVIFFYERRDEIYKLISEFKQNIFLVEFLEALKNERAFIRNLQ